MNTTASTSSDTARIESEIDASCRTPLFVLFPGAAVWLVVASVFGMIASIKFHSPVFLADSGWLTYGRVRAVANFALLYGFLIQAGLGVALWIFARMGQTTASQPWLMGAGGKLWNFGMLVGAIGIFIGDFTGFDNLEMPRYAAVILFAAYLLIALWIVLTLQNRNERALQPTQWFLLAALFWFPWIFSTAHLLLTVFPVRGVTQSVIVWWFSANLQLVCFGLLGLGVLFYFLPKLINRPLHSRHLALFTFWTLILFASWSGIPNGAPVPAWIPALSTVATVLTIVTVLSVVMNVFKTCQGCAKNENPVPGKFIAFGVIGFVLAWVMNILNAFPQIGMVTQFTWFTVAQAHFNVYAFLSMILFGAIYYIAPRAAGIEWPSPGLVRAHYWLAVLGIILFAVPLAVGGVMQGMKLNSPPADFIKVTLHFLRVSTLGELLILAGHLLLLRNLLGLVVRYGRARFTPFCADALAEVKPAEVKS